MGSKLYDAEAGTNGVDLATGAGGSGSSTGEVLTGLTKTGGASLKFANDFVGHGNLAYKAIVASGETAFAVFQPAVVTTQVAVRFNFRVDPLPATATTFFAVTNDAGTTTMNINLSGTGRLVCTDALGGSLTTVLPLTATTWYRVEELIDQGDSTSTGLATLRFGLLDDGPPIETLAEEATRNAGFGTNLERVAFGKINTSSYAGSIWIDDIVVEGPVANFIGAAVPMKTTTTIRPRTGGR